MEYQMSEQRTRRAVVTGGWDTIRQLEAYMPSNYRVISRGADMSPIIEGHDVAGWTLDGYVIPRLASGLIFAEEIDVDEGEPSEAELERAAENVGTPPWMRV